LSCSRQRAPDARGEQELSELLAGQIDYYRARAPEYERGTIPGFDGGELEAALDAFAPCGDVLELACGTGAWTRQLARHASTLTAVDASPEMIAIARERLAGRPVRFVRADIFAWRPDRRYDVVAFGFWLSHVPLELFERFWQLVDEALAPAGRVFFVDDAHRDPAEAIPGCDHVVRRTLSYSRAAHRVVKVAHTPASLEARMAELGWRFTVTQAEGPFFWGEGRRG
jgi:SAM-dependent methyltransferase